MLGAKKRSKLARISFWRARSQAIISSAGSSVQGSTNVTAPPNPNPNPCGTVKDPFAKTTNAEVCQDTVGWTNGYTACHLSRGADFGARRILYGPELGI